MFGSCQFPRRARTGARRPLSSATVALGLSVAGFQAGGAGLQSATPVNGSPAGLDGSRSPAVPSAAPGPTYLRNVRPILMGKCLRCHDQATILGYWVDYQTAFSHRRQIRRRVWDSWKGDYYKEPMPAENSSESEAMTEGERKTIKDWVDAGAPYGVAPAPSGPLETKAERMQHGKQLFDTICAVCHQPNAQGIPSKFPPLAGSDFLNANKERAVGIVIRGLQGEVTVNRRTFVNSMPSFPLSDGDIASVLTYVYNSFGNSGKDVTPEEVTALRPQGQDQGPLVLQKTNAAANPSPEINPYE